MPSTGWRTRRPLPDPTGWRSDLAGAEAEARTSNKLVFIDFTADWCPSCQELKQTLFKDPAVISAIQARFVPVRIDVDQQPEIASHFKVEQLPALAIVDPKGQTLRYEEIAPTKEEFLAWLKPG